MIQARSIGRRAADMLDQAPQGGRVLACFTRAWNLLIDTGQVCALAWAGVPDGPFNILLDNVPGLAPPPGARYLMSGTRILLPADAAGISLEIETATARVWDPQIDWDALAADHGRILAGLPIVTGMLAVGANLALTSRQPDSILLGSFSDSSHMAARLTQEKGREALARFTGLRSLSTSPLGSCAFPPRTSLCLRSPSPSGSCALPTRMALCFASQEVRPHELKSLSYLQAGAARLAGWRTSSQQDLAAAVMALCGLGPGLTPAGDDWLAGWLLALRLCEAADARWVRQADAGRHAVWEAATARTTTLSRAFLTCAVAGEADAHWHALLQALAEGAPQAIEAAARRILAHGATSGAAMLAGFVMGLGVEREIAPCC